jgi:hypothetical protein
VPENPKYGPPGGLIEPVLYYHHSSSHPHLHSHDASPRDDIVGGSMHELNRQYSVPVWGALGDNPLINSNGG